MATTRGFVGIKPLAVLLLAVLASGHVRASPEGCNATMVDAALGWLTLPVRSAEASLDWDNLIDEGAELSMLATMDEVEQALLFIGVEAVEADLSEESLDESQAVQLAGCNATDLLGALGWLVEPLADAALAREQNATGLVAVTAQPAAGELAAAAAFLTEVAAGGGGMPPGSGGGGGLSFGVSSHGVQVAGAPETMAHPDGTVFYRNAADVDVYGYLIVHNRFRRRIDVLVEKSIRIDFDKNTRTVGSGAYQRMTFWPQLKKHESGNIANDGYVFYQPGMLGSVKFAATRRRNGVMQTQVLGGLQIRQERDAVLPQPYFGGGGNATYHRLKLMRNRALLQAFPWSNAVLYPDVVLPPGEQGAGVPPLPGAVYWSGAAVPEGGSGGCLGTIEVEVLPNGQYLTRYSACPPVVMRAGK